MAYIDNISDWWGHVDHEWDGLLGIVAHHIDLRHVAYEEPGVSSSPMTGRLVLEEMIRLKQDRDQRLARYFFAAWAMAAEAYAWSVPSWGTLCDLLSEEWVFGGDAAGISPAVVQAHLAGHEA